MRLSRDTCARTDGPIGLASTDHRPYPRQRESIPSASTNTKSRGRPSTSRNPRRIPPAHSRSFVSNVGNHAFGGAIARTQGAGIMAERRGPLERAVEDRLHARQRAEPRHRRRSEKLSPSLGDLSDVRVHTDSTAHDLNHAVSARAFATGTDVYFAQNEYKPNTSDGDKLIAHELAHVVQQRGAPDQRPAHRLESWRRHGDRGGRRGRPDQPKWLEISFGFIDRRVMAAVERVAGLRPRSRRSVPRPVHLRRGRAAAHAGRQRVRRRRAPAERRRRRSGSICSRRRCSRSARRPSSTRATGACTPTCRTTSRASCRARGSSGSCSRARASPPPT